MRATTMMRRTTVLLVWITKIPETDKKKKPQADKNLDEYTQGLNDVVGPDNTVEP